jgi:hypothetical protein
MINKITRMVGIFIVTLLLASCSIILPVNASGAPLGKKVGEAKATIILGLYFGQDAGIQTAAKNGNITKVATVDVKKFNLLGFYQTVTTIVTGE